MNINNAEAMKLRDQIRVVAENRIKCQCSNDNWEQFIYIDASTQLLAACKKCGTAYSYDTVDDMWRSIL
jgi:hypothetical protein